MPDQTVPGVANGLPKIKIALEDIIGEAQSLVQAIFLAAAGLASNDDKNAIAIVAGEAADRLGMIRDLLDEVQGA
ncbi:hypothetical protein [Sinorhizobium meliloti]|uniref:hypothetical protein n=1 Tax=Rhizobium meliloti TaxID=382 RepID=UPI000FD90B17|nr:hypothetical protein [Sinorhizobium meliloti]QGJ73790.1 hypothetical protein C3L21_07060 [Sinorhizobium meliloti]RVG89049.1 hypothetical protein CN218_26220 [Sinorhizobium meliloti]RVK89653.1 hypothetical protein CN150_30190 [Sinorhizobium meliloti]RVL60746.1 hypothetical protein CN137_18290 [Sinorhizobium meliloti]